MNLKGSCILLPLTTIIPASAYVVRSNPPRDNFRNLSTPDALETSQNLSTPFTNRNEPLGLELEEKAFHEREELPVNDIVAALLAEGIKTWKEPLRHNAPTYVQSTCVRQVCTRLEAFVKTTNIWATWVAFKTFLVLEEVNKSKDIWTVPTLRVIRDERTVAESAFISAQVSATANGMKGISPSNGTDSLSNLIAPARDPLRIVTSISLTPDPTKAHVNEVGTMMVKLIWEYIFALKSVGNIPWPRNKIMGAAGSPTDMFVVAIKRTRVGGVDITNEMVAQALYELWLKVPYGFVGHWVGKARLGGNAERDVFLEARVSARLVAKVGSGEEDDEIEIISTEALQGGEQDVVPSQQWFNETVSGGTDGTSKIVEIL